MKDTHNNSDSIKSQKDNNKRIYIIAISFFIILLTIVARRSISENSTEDVLDKKEEALYNATNFNNASINIPNKENLIIGEYIPNNILEISVTNYYPDISDPLGYTTADTQKLNEIVNLFADANWVEFEPKYEYHCMCSIKIKGSTEIEFLMMGIPTVKIKNNNEEKFYKIKENEYKEILDSVGINYNVKYYLHKSKLDIPKEDKLLNLQKQIFKDLTNEDISEVQDIIRWTHMNMEMQLVDSVNIIKNPESLYWEQSNYGGEFTDPLTGVGTDKGDYCFNTKLEKLERIKDLIKNEETKKEFENIIQIFKTAMEKHDLLGCFKVHEFIHDYDYFAINYPAYFEDAPPPDWEGINVYFGHLKFIR